MADKKMRYHVAETLDEMFMNHDFTEEERTALDIAIAIVSPEYIQDAAKELEDGMNSEDAKAFSKNIMQTDKAKKIIEDHGGTVNGKIIRFGEKKHD